MLKDYRQAHLYAEKALSHNCDNCKALYNRAVAGTHLQLYSEAEADFKKVLQMNPNDAKAKSEFERLKKNRLLKKSAMAKGFLDADKKHGHLSLPEVNYHAKLPLYNTHNPKVFFDIELTEQTRVVLGHLVFELWKNYVPRTA